MDVTLHTSLCLDLAQNGVPDALLCVFLCFVTSYIMMDICGQLHGRTRQQRYTRLADWNYIKQCVEAVRAREADEGCTSTVFKRMSLVHSHLS